MLVIVLCGGALWFAHWRRGLRHFDATSLVESLPPDQATHVYVDVDALRRSGILGLVAGSAAAEDPDYRNFVQETGFDYRSDLDAVAAAFLHGNVYFVLKGRFDWKLLSKYARAHEGKCLNATCDMPASTPDRHISFYPLNSDVLALAVGTEERAVTMIGPKQWHTPPQLPPEPVWISAPSYAFSDVNSSPVGDAFFF